MALRGVIHLGLSVLLLICFGQAPFAHFHAGDPGHEHADGMGHAHFGGHDADAPEIEAEEPHDEDASLLDWLAGDGTSGAKFALAMPVKMFALGLETCDITIAEPATRSHDPPGLARLPGRSPPL